MDVCGEHKGFAVPEEGLLLSLVRAGMWLQEGGDRGGDRVVGQDGGFSCVPASMGSLLAGAEPRLGECCSSVLPCTLVNDNEPGCSAN